MMVVVVQVVELCWCNWLYMLVVEGKKVGDFICELVVFQGVMVVVDLKVEGIINGKFLGLLVSMFNIVCVIYGFMWYYDGLFIYVDCVDDLQMQVFLILKGSGLEFVQILCVMQIIDQCFLFVVSDKENIVYVFGLKCYVEFVCQVIVLIVDLLCGMDCVEICVFLFKYVWVGDVEINWFGKFVMIFGIVIMMCCLLGVFNLGVSSFGMLFMCVMWLIGLMWQMKFSFGDSINVLCIEILLVGV